MDIKEKQTASPKLERCAYLGLREDPQTALDFPSVWNFCHKVKRPGSVAMEYQRDFCQVAAHRQCPIVEAERVWALPAQARSRNPYGMNLGQGFWFLLVVILSLALGAWLFWIYNPAGSQTRSLPGFLHFSPAALVTATREISASTSAAPSLTDTPGLPSPVPSSTDASASQSSSTVEMACGYQLEQTIRAGYQLILHRAVSGENLNKYASDYNTTVEAILAANYQLPVPLRIDWVLVIPVGITEMQGMPPFEPYFESTQGLSLNDIAGMLSMNESTLRKYNIFDEACQSVSGWLLIPRSVVP